MEKNNKGEAWWKPAISIFGEVSVWVVIPIILALVIGKQLDVQYGTKPWIFLGLSCIGFLVSSFGIVRTVRVYIRKIEPSTSSGQEKQNDRTKNNQK